jgi:hypothetical protein
MNSTMTQYTKSRIFQDGRGNEAAARYWHVSRGLFAHAEQSVQIRSQRQEFSPLVVLVLQKTA